MWQILYKLSALSIHLSRGLFEKITANKETEERFAATGIHTPPNISKAGIKDLWPKQQLLTQGNQIIDYKSKCT